MDEGAIPPLEQPLGRVPLDKVEFTIGQRKRSPLKQGRFRENNTRRVETHYSKEPVTIREGDYIRFIHPLRMTYIKPESFGGPEGGIDGYEYRGKVVGIYSDKGEFERIFRTEAKFPGIYYNDENAGQFVAIVLDEDADTSGTESKTPKITDFPVVTIREGFVKNEMAEK
jgi:hypothetical protein